MYYQHGNHSAQAANTVTISNYSQQTEYNEQGLQATRTTTMTLQGVLIASTQAAIKTAIENLETTFNDTTVAKSGLYHDDGSDSPHVLFAAGTLGGIRLLSLEYPEGDGAEYATQRTFRVVLQTVKGIEITQGGGSNINSSYDETIQISGGLPRYVALTVMQGPPIIQRVASHSPIITVQSGRAVRQGGYGPPPVQLVGVGYLTDKQESQIAPRSVGGTLRDYGLEWQYTYLRAQ